MSRKQRSRKQRLTFRQIYDASPMIQRNIFMAAVCFGLVALLVVILFVAGLIRAWFF